MPLSKFLGLSVLVIAISFVLMAATDAVNAESEASGSTAAELENRSAPTDLTLTSEATKEIERIPKANLLPTQSPPIGGADVASSRTVALSWPVKLGLIIYAISFLSLVLAFVIWYKENPPYG